MLLHFPQINQNYIYFCNFSIAHCSFLVIYLCFVLCLIIRGVVFMATILPAVIFFFKKSFAFIL